MIFVDTSFWVALRNRRDGQHDQATRLWRAYADAQLITSNKVRGETWTFLRRRAGHAAAVSYLDSLGASPRVTVARVTGEEEERALAWLRRHDEREYSFVDATSFDLMRVRRIAEALAFNGDFAAAGFTELRRQDHGVPAGRSVSNVAMEQQFFTASRMAVGADLDEAELADQV